MTGFVPFDPPTMRPHFGEPAGALTFWGQRHHPLVRTELRRTRRWRSSVAWPCVGVPLLAFAAALLLSASAQFDDLGRQLAVGFTAIWPAIMLAGAALRAAGAVVSERTEDTAMQLALTPLSKRSIAAAKILPSVRPFLWGLAAALPVYALAGILMDGLLVVSWIPSGPVAWPLRLLMAGNHDDPEFGFLGALAGPVMVLTDAGLVWIGAHVGAALAMRHASLPRAALHLLGRQLANAAGFLIFCFCVGMAAGLLLIGSLALIGDDAPAGPVIGVVLAVAMCVGALYLWWRETLRNAVDLALLEFSQFDRLAMDEAEFPPPGRGAGWVSLSVPERM